MKKLLIVLQFVLFFSSLSGNVIAPRAWISEILVDSTGNWTIEMGFYAYDVYEIDSIRLVTSTGNSIILTYDLLPYGGTGEFDSLSVITDANLATYVSINPVGDFVRLISYVWDYEEIDYVAFGNYPGSYLDCMFEGESIITCGWEAFCIDSSPTIGEGNDGVGYTGYYSGFAYDLAGHAITTGFVNTIGNDILSLQPDSQGFFNELVYSRRYTFDTVEHIYPPWPYNKFTYTCEPVDFCLRPDSSYYHDIITTSLIIGIDDKEVIDENIVTIAPNPFSDKVVFYFNPDNIDHGEMDFIIYSQDGREVQHIILSHDQKRYEWSPQNSISSGTYIYLLKKDSHIVKSGKFVRL
jgi:hypothetical protein